MPNERCRLAARWLRAVTDVAAHLVDRLRACDPTAPAELFDRVFEKVFVYAAALTATPAEAAELAQDVLRSALSGLDDSTGVGNELDLLGWLFRIARTRGADLYPPSTAPEDGAAPRTAEARANGFWAVRALRATERDVVVCLVLLGYDVGDTSRLLRMPPEQVARARSDALATLHSALASPVAVA